MATIMASHYPILPPELEYEVFTISAHEYPETVKPISLVAHRVRGWIEPCLFHIISLLGRQQTVNDLLEIFKHRSYRPDDLANYVHRLYIPEQVDPEDTARLLSSFPNLKQLTVLSELDEDMCHDIVTTMPLEVLVLSASNVPVFFDTLEAENVIMDELTFLDLGDFDSSDYEIPIEANDALPSLRCLAVTGNWDAPSVEFAGQMEFVRPFLEHSGLRVFILRFATLANWSCMLFEGPSNSLAGLLGVPAAPYTPEMIWHASVRADGSDLWTMSLEFVVTAFAKGMESLFDGRIQMLFEPDEDENEDDDDEEVITSSHSESSRESNGEGSDNHASQDLGVDRK